MTRWHLTFSGKVQHVGFRYTASYLARELYITGWVRNRDDGSVEMEAQAPVSLLRSFLIRLKALPNVHIEQTSIEEIQPVIADRHFRILF